MKQSTLLKLLRKFSFYCGECVNDCKYFYDRQCHIFIETDCPSRKQKTNKNTTKLRHAGIATRKPSNSILSSQAENKNGKSINKGQYDKVASVSKVGWQSVQMGFAL